MQAYGRKKHGTAVAGHQDCGTCHPVQKSKTARARREAKQAAFPIDEMRRRELTPSSRRTIAEALANLSPENRWDLDQDLLLYGNAFVHIQRRNADDIEAHRVSPRSVTLTGPCDDCFYGPASVCNAECEP